MAGRRSRLTDRDAALAIIERLSSRAHTAYLAGGCVRDELLGVTPKDYDVATSARPEQIEGLFSKTAAVGAAFGVMLVREFGPAIEVATFRADGPYSDSRRPDHVEFADAARDAHRRDFTINALFIDPAREGEDRIIDFVGGRADVRARVVRAVGDPRARLAEDHLRALRAVRFAARYDLALDPATADAIRSDASALSGVSVERVGHEVRRMMGGSGRARAAGLIQALGLDAPVFGRSAGAIELRTIEALDERAAHTTALGAWAHDREGRAVLLESSVSASAWRSRLDMSTDETRAFAGALGFVGRVIDQWDALGVAPRKRLASSSIAGEGAMLLRAVSTDAAGAFEQDTQQLANDGVGLAPAPLIDGDLLVARGFAPGPGFGRVLDDVYDAQLEGRVGTVDDAIALAQIAADTHGVARA